jgi:peptidoglycan-associated lipoprotein
MKFKVQQLLVLAVVLVAAMFLGACAKKKVAVTTPPAPPPAAKPTASLELSRTDIQKGDSTVLSWNTSNASTVEIAGLGTVAASGNKTLSPSDSTTYLMTAKGPGGEADASARVTVNTPMAAATPSPTLERLFAENVKDVYFDYDKYGIRASDEAAADVDAKFLAAHPEAKVLIEGHCDERGSEDYNIALGDNRAGSTRDFLTKAGVSPSQIKTISYGKEKPFCTAGDNESCLQQNRRAHFVLATENTTAGN